MLFGMAECLREADPGFTMRQAEENANNFKFPEEVFTRDEDELRSFTVGNPLVELIRKRQSVGNTDRFNVARAMLFSDDIEFDRLMDLAKGVEIMTDSNFIPNISQSTSEAGIESVDILNPPPRLRNKYLAVSSAVNMLVHKLFVKGLIVIVSMSVALSLATKFSCTHWTTKKGKVGGRLLADSSYDEFGNPLNTPEVKLMCDARWGRIVHPTVNDLAEMVKRVVSAHPLGWKGVILWKMDLSGAFTLLSIKPECVPLLAFPLTDNLCMFYGAGFYGWTGFPQGFGVLTRVLDRSINLVIDGECLAYVDDVMGASPIESIEHDIRACSEVMTTLLGSKAIEHEKTEIDTRVVWIGWNFDLSSQSISIADHNLQKALHGFLSIDESKPVPFTQLERVASFAQRYSLICTELKPYTNYFYSLYPQAYGNRHISITLQEEVRTCLLVWRAALGSLMLEEGTSDRRILSLCKEPHSFVIWFDGSLTGAGYVIYDSDEQNVLFYSRIIYPFQLVKAYMSGDLVSASQSEKD